MIRLVWQLGLSIALWVHLSTAEGTGFDKYTFFQHIVQDPVPQQR